MTYKAICINLVFCYIFRGLKCYFLHLGYTTIDAYPWTIVFVPFLFVTVINIIMFSVHSKFKYAKKSDFFVFGIQRIIILVYFVFSLVCLDALCLYLNRFPLFFNLYSVVIYRLSSNWDIFVLSKSSNIDFSATLNPVTTNPGSPGNGGEPSPGGNNSDLAHYSADQRARSSSSSSSISEYSELVHDSDSEYVKDKKFANFIFDTECRTIYVNQERDIFDNSDSNPLNWKRSDSPLHQRISREIESRLISTDSNRSTRIDNGEFIPNRNQYTLAQLEIGTSHPLFGSIKNILFPNSINRTVKPQNIIIYDPVLGLDKLKAIKCAEK